MTDITQALRKKFSGSGDSLGQAGAAPPARMASLVRRRRKLRLSCETDENLRILKVALCQDVNALCEEILSKAAAAKIKEAKASTPEGEWDVILRAARRP